MCFDACPVTACLPYTAKRMRALTPNAKLVFMVRSGHYRAVDSWESTHLNLPAAWLGPMMWYATLS